LDGLWLFGGLIAIIAIIAVVFVTYYNRIRVLANRVEEAWAQIDVQLKKRFDLVPNLVETVKGAGMVTGSREERMEASNALTGALRTLFAVAEAYPDLKAAQNFKLLQEQLEGIENKIAYSRQYYNSSVLRFNNLITTIPGVWFAGGRQKMAFLEIPEAEREAVRVKF